MMKREEVQFVLDDGPEQDFTSAKLQIQNDGPSVVSSKSVARNVNEYYDSETLFNGNILPAQSPHDNSGVTFNGESAKVRPNSLAVVPWSGENARDYFSYRDGLVTNAVHECSQILTPEDGEVLGSWLLTEISFWDHEKERLVLLTSKFMFIIKYDFIALKKLDHKKVLLDTIDTIIIGELSYPAASLIPHLDGLATGVSGVVKDCLVRPIQERLAGMPSCTNTNPFRTNNFEARSRKMSGVRAMWNGGEPLPFMKKWNPFEKEIPFSTFTSHPLLWHKDGTDVERRIYNVDDFTAVLSSALERRQRNFQCTVQQKPILLENYIGLGSLIHNKNSLGFFKVRGKFSF